MAIANTSINVAELDFSSIKSSLKQYLQNQTQFQDYNFEGSVISTVLDLLAYNTHYNAFYTNMVANEMFLDTALKRSSVISHAKLMNYTPKSARCSKVNLNLTFSGVTDLSLTIPKYTTFYSKALEGINYSFVNTQLVSANRDSGGNVTFNDLELQQGIPVIYTYTYSGTDTTQKFKLPDGNIDTTTLSVLVKPSSGSPSYKTYTQATELLYLDDTSEVYFIQESLDGFYEIYFGDGVLGKQLSDSNVIIVSYLVTEGSSANDISSFSLMANLGNYANVTLNPTVDTNGNIISSSGGSGKETLDSIKYQAPKSFSAQNRAVTKDDYITAIQQNKFGYTFDAVNVWGGEENEPPLYGQILVCLKPAGSYFFTTTQKQKILEEVIKPISVLTVQPKMVDPDYTYIKITADVLYDQKSTNKTETQLQSDIKTAIELFCNSTLNTFNSTFMTSKLNAYLSSVDPSIITNEITIQVQKKFFPNLTGSNNYQLKFDIPLKKGVLFEGVNSYPPMQFLDKINPSKIIEGIQLEEVPSYTNAIESISITNPGISYQSAPIVNIVGDGAGATAEAILSATGTIRTINVLTAGAGYTSAIVQIIPAANDTTGKFGSAVVNLQGKYGTIRSYFNDKDNVKTVFDGNIGTIDYDSGVIELKNFNPIGVKNSLGELTISVNPTTSIVSSNRDKIITVDAFDPFSIVVNLMAK